MTVAYPGYGVIAIKGIAAVTALMDATRCVYDSVEAKTVPLDAGLDFTADVFEIMLMYLRLELNNPTGNPGVIVPGGFENYTKDFSRNKNITKSIAALCYGIVYGTFTLINALEQLNGWGEPDTGNAFIPDNGQSKFCEVSSILRSADPDPNNWSSDAARNHTDANQDLIALSDRTAAADTATASTLNLQADQVRQLRIELAATKLTLIELLALIMAFLGPLNFMAAKANTFPMDESAEYFVKPKWSKTVESITQAAEPWLPYIVLPPCIAATITAGTLFGLLIDDGNSNANDLQDQTAEYQDVAYQANKICANRSTRPLTRAPAAPIANAPSFAALFLTPGRSATATPAASPATHSPTRTGADPSPPPATRISASWAQHMSALNQNTGVAHQPASTTQRKTATSAEEETPPSAEASTTDNEGVSIDTAPPKSPPSAAEPRPTAQRTA